MDTQQQRAYSPALLAAQKRLQGLRQQHQNSCQRSLPPAASRSKTTHTSPPTPIRSENQPKNIKLYPDIALAMLKEGLASAGRVWLLLKHIDSTGSGRVDTQVARNRLTTKSDPLHICGWRQLRKLLKRGEGIFWYRHGARIWLRSPAKVAATLNVSRLTGRPVALPVQVLLKGMGTVRAHFYASFHSGRTQPATGALRAKPIARATLRQLSHLSRRTQRNYEKRTGIGRQYNYAVGKGNTIKERQERAWKHGRAFFHFTDHQGLVGRKGASYTAWQLPNCYFGPHAQQPVGRQKRINRELADLFMKGMTGNDKRSAIGVRNNSRQDHAQGYAIGGTKAICSFHRSGASAARSYNRHPNRDAYWRTHLGQKGRYRIWHLLPAQE